MDNRDLAALEHAVGLALIVVVAGLGAAALITTVLALIVVSAR